MAAVKLRHFVLPLLVGAFIFFCLPSGSDAWWLKAMYDNFVSTHIKGEKTGYDVRKFSKGMADMMRANEEARRAAYAERQRKIASGEIIIISAEQARKNWMEWREKNRRKIAAWGFEESINEVINQQIDRLIARTRVLKDKPALDCQRNGNLAFPLKRCNYKKSFNESIANDLEARTAYPEASAFGKVVGCPVAHTRCYFVDPVPVRSRVEAEMNCRASRGRLASIYNAALQEKVNDFVLKKLNPPGEEKPVRVWTAGKVGLGQTDGNIKWLKFGKYNKEVVKREQKEIPKYVLTPDYGEDGEAGHWYENQPQNIKDWYGDDHHSHVYMIASADISKMGFVNTEMIIAEQDKHDFYPLCEQDVYSEVKEYDFLDPRHIQPDPYVHTYLPKKEFDV